MSSTEATSASAFSRPSSLSFSLASSASARSSALCRETDQKQQGEVSLSKDKKKAYVEKQSYPKTTFQRVSLVAEPNILGAEADELIHQRLSKNSVAKRNLE
jgi:hypothetical protein